MPKHSRAPKKNPKRDKARLGEAPEVEYVDSLDEIVHDGMVAVLTQPTADDIEKYRGTGYKLYALRKEVPPGDFERYVDKVEWQLNVRALSSDIQVKLADLNQAEAAGDRDTVAAKRKSLRALKAGWAQLLEDGKRKEYSKSLFTKETRPSSAEAGGSPGSGKQKTASALKPIPSKTRNGPAMGKVQYIDSLSQVQPGFDDCWIVLRPTTEAEIEERAKQGFKKMYCMTKEVTEEDIDTMRKNIVHGMIVITGDTVEDKARKAAMMDDEQTTVAAETVNEAGDCPDIKTRNGPAKIEVDDEEEWHDEEIHGAFNPAEPKCKCAIS